MINKHHLRTLIQETLQEISTVIPYSEDAVELLMMTCAHESQLGTWLRQHKGPAKGIFQIEPSTEEDVWNNFLHYRIPFAETVDSYSTDTGDDLSYNLQYQVVLARVIYYRVPEKLPENTWDMAKYAKEHWNTHLGKATIADYLTAYEKLCRLGY